MQKSVSVAFAVQQLLDCILAARLVSQSVEGLHFNNKDDERNAISSVIAILELVGLQGQNLQRCLRGELDPIAIFNCGNAGSVEDIVDWKDIKLHIKQGRKPVREDDDK